MKTFAFAFAQAVPEEHRNTVKLAQKIAARDDIGFTEALARIKVSPELGKLLRDQGIRASR